MAAALPALAAAPDAVDRLIDATKSFGRTLADSAGLTGSGEGWIPVGAFLASLYNDFAIWWDGFFAPGTVGSALGVRGTLPFVAAGSNGEPTLYTGAAASAAAGSVSKAAAAAATNAEPWEVAGPLAGLAEWSFKEIEGWW